MSFTLTSDLRATENNVQFTLTCISIGGPATTVNWNSDSETLIGDTVLNDSETAQYTHTLNVIGRHGGFYTCTVANDRPSQSVAQLHIQGIELKNADNTDNSTSRCDRVCILSM